MRDDFCAFILTHGRPDNVKTLKTLEKAGYTGKVYIVIDDEDDNEQEYRKIAQGGDFIGGAKSLNFRKGILRKAMNTFICDTERPFTFVGRINEDVNTYVTLGSRGG